MEFYIVNILIILLNGAILNIVKKKCNNSKQCDMIFMVITCVQLGLVVCLRSPSVGTDTKPYSEMFSKIVYNDMDDMVLWESAPLYLAIQKLITIFTQNPQWSIAINAAFIIIGICVFIYRNSRNCIVSIYFYISFTFFFTSMNGTRQYMAMALIVNSYYYLKNNKKIKFVILLILATLIHNTAFIFVLLLPLSKIKWNTTKILFFSGITTIAMLFYNYIMALFFIIFPRYSMYIGGSVHSINDTGQGKKIMVTFLYLAILLACLLFLKYNKHLELFVKNELYLLSVIMTIAVTIGIIFYNNLLISRIEMYFSLFVIIYIPNFIENIKNEKLRATIYYWLMVIAFAPCYSQLSKNAGGVLPYLFFWE